VLLALLLLLLLLEKRLLGCNPCVLLIVEETVRL
jgi:hypothetical protein